MIVAVWRFWTLFPYFGLFRTFFLLYTLLYIHILGLNTNSIQIQNSFIKPQRKINCCSSCRFIIDGFCCGQEGSPVEVCVAADLKTLLTEALWVWGKQLTIPGRLWCCLSHGAEWVEESCSALCLMFYEMLLMFMCLGLSCTRHVLNKKTCLALKTLLLNHCVV